MQDKQTKFLIGLNILISYYSTYKRDELS